MRRIFATGVLSWLLAGLMFAGLPAQAASPDDARNLVQQTSEQLLQRLVGERAALEADPSLVYPLVQDLVLPHFDFERMSQWVLGKYWRTASEAQQQQFTKEFQTLLVRTYAQALLEYTGQSINYLPLNAAADAERVLVRTEVQQRGAPPISLTYSMHLRDNAWKVFDISVEGVSLVTNYRSSFATEIRQGGMEQLINRLEAMNSKAPQRG